MRRLCKIIQKIGHSGRQLPRAASSGGGNITHILLFFKKSKWTRTEIQVDIVQETSYR